MNATKDRQERGLVLTKPERTPEGFLKAPVIATRAGIFEYLRPDGSIRRELRPPEEVFDPESMASLAGIPFVDGHPAKEGNVVDAGNATRLMRGFTGGVPYKQGDNLGVDLTVTDGDLIDDIDNGKRAVSLGYSMELDETPGSWQGKHYDAVQRKIRYNHLAAVRRARAGYVAKIRLDDADNVITETEPEERPMRKIKVDGKDLEVSDEIADAMEKALSRADAADAVKAAKQRADEALEKANGERDQALGKLAGLERQRADAESVEAKQRADAAIKARVKTLSNLLAIAKSVLPKKEQARLRLDDMDERQIMETVIRADNADEELAGKSDDYVQGLFAALTRPEARTARADGGLGGDILEDRRADGPGGQGDTEEDDEEDEEDEEDRADRGGRRDGRRDKNKAISFEEARARRKDEATSRWKRPMNGKNINPGAIQTGYGVHA